MTAGIRIYRGLSRREHAGWVLGLRPGQAFVCLLLALPVVLALSAGNLIKALVLTAVCGPIAAVVVVPVRGRPAARWLWHLLLFQLGMVFGWTRWQSKAAAGQSNDPGEPDLPGMLARLRFPDGPPMRELGRVCLIHDTVERRWGATARLTHGGVGMLSDAQCTRLANRLGTLLLSISQREVIDRMSLLVRTVPDTGADYEAWRAAHDAPDAPALTRSVTAELDRTVGAASVRHEIFVTVSGTEDALRKPATAAGGGVAGRAAVLYRTLDGLEEPLRALGAQRVSWLSGAALAEAIRTGFNPATAAGLAARHHRHDQTGMPAVPWAAAGPTHAPSPSPRIYRHDGYATVSYSVLMPEAGTTFGSLAGLLAVRARGERRSLAIHYQTLSLRQSRRTVRGNRWRSGVVRDWKRGKGFGTNAADTRDARGARAQEQAVAAGHGVVRFAVATAVTVPDSWNVEDHAARVENAVSGRFRLLRMEFAQDSGFVAAVLPVGLGLPKYRGGGL